MLLTSSGQAAWSRRSPPRIAGDEVSSRSVATSASDSQRWRRLRRGCRALEFEWATGGRRRTSRSCSRSIRSQAASANAQRDLDRLTNPLRELARVGRARADRGRRRCQLTARLRSRRRVGRPTSPSAVREGVDGAAGARAGAVSERAVGDAVSRLRAPRYYFDWKERRPGRQGETPFTTAVSVALRAAGRHPDDRGRGLAMSRAARSTCRATQAGLAALGFKLFAREGSAQHRTAALPPDGQTSSLSASYCTTIRRRDRGQARTRWPAR